jgi:aspartate-semialdehyde dehydrogenase
VSRSPTKSTGRRIVIYGVTGQLGRELVEELDSSGWPVGELVGVASPASLGKDFDFRGEALDVVAEPPALKGRDLVLVCTPKGQALEIVRAALLAEVPCIDCSGSLASQPAVPLAHPAAKGLESAPLIAIPASTTLTWRPVLEALRDAAGLARLSGTVLCSAAAWGREGVSSLSDESIALFNQSEPPESGPAGRPVAFDVVPGGAIDLERVRAELAQEMGEGLRLAIGAVQVPTFVGEGAVLSLDLERPLTREQVERILSERGEILLGERPSMRDALGRPAILLGPVEVDESGAPGLAYRLWLASDPLRIVADAALRAAGRRLGIE